MPAEATSAPTFTLSSESTRISAITTTTQVITARPTVPSVRVRCTARAFT
jgi:hypothetical protein